MNMATIIDSGTTFTYVPTAMHRAFAASLPKHSDGSSWPIGERRPSVRRRVLRRRVHADGGHRGQFFPSLTIDYGDDGSIELGPEILRHRRRDRRRRLSVDLRGSFWNKIILGQITMRDTLVTFDVGAHRVNMTTLNCRALQQRYVGANETSSPPPPLRLAAARRAVAHRIDLAIRLVGFGGTAAALGGSALARRLRARNANDRQWRRLEEDTLDAPIELIDQPRRTGVAVCKIT